MTSVFSRPEYELSEEPISARDALRVEHAEEGEDQANPSPQGPFLERPLTPPTPEAELESDRVEDP